MVFFLLIFGFVLLIKGADWLVDGATAVASRVGISELVIGLTIVSMGTSMPELIISVIASAKGNSGLATGNVFGSNIANVLLILGATALICDLPVHRNTVLSELPFSLAAALLIGFLANSTLWYEPVDDVSISRGDGIIVLFFFFLFLTYILIVAKESQKKPDESFAPPTPLGRNIMLIAVGAAGLFLGGKWVVDGAVYIAGLFGLSDTLIGLTVVALGTSLPELVTSLMAAFKRNTDIAIGNAVGSNIFNLLWILGISAVIRPLPFNVASNMDILVVIASSCLVILSLIIGRRLLIRRTEGIVFLLAYAIYLVFVVERG